MVKAPMLVLGITLAVGIPTVEFDVAECVVLRVVEVVVAFLAIVLIDTAELAAAEVMEWLPVAEVTEPAADETLAAADDAEMEDDGGGAAAPPVMVIGPQ